MFLKYIDIETELEQQMAKLFPQVAYEGGIDVTEDEQDYTAYALRGVRLG